MSGDTLVILSPGFAADENDDCLPAQESFIRAVNRNYPQLRVIILSFHYPFNRQESYEWHGNTVIPFAAKKKGKLWTAWLWLRVWRRLRIVRKRCNIAGIFSFFCSESAFIGHHFAKLHGLRHLIWILGQDAKKENKQVARIRPDAKELVAISDFLVKSFEQNHGIRPAHMIPIGIDTTQFRPLPATRDIDLLGAGSLIPLKQYDIFIRVASKITGEFPGLRAVICGDGPEKRRLQALIDELGLRGNISLTGNLSHTETLLLMQRSRILLHPSAYEGLGAVCLEALYAGARVVSFCQPFNQAIDHWDITRGEQQMTDRVLELLRTAALDHKPVLPFEANSIAVHIIRLFDT